MSEINTAGVTGTDGVTPIYQPEGTWRIWAKHEIYFGGPGAKRYVPKVKDYVIDVDQYITYIVDSLDLVTLIPVLRQIKPSGMVFELSDEDILFGVGPGTPSDTYRVYFNDRVIPHVLAVDQRLKVQGSQSSYAKIYRGVDISDPTKVIGRVYDQNGNYISDNIPLEVAAIETHTNHSIRNVSVCHTSTNLTNGEVVTVVVYNNLGIVVSKRQCVVESTGFVRTAQSAIKYISGISLDSPFMSQTSPNLIEFPLNVPTQSLGLVGITHYSDGSSSPPLPVDGTKFKISGLDQYVSTQEGQRLNLVLHYNLGPGEATFANTSVDNKTIHESYQLITTQVDGSYSVKLFGYPTWVNSISGYKMEWWLYNLERNQVFNVTGLVTFSDNTGPFEPTTYGVLQRKTVRINLRDVSAAYKPYIHTQTIDIYLKRSAGDDLTLWNVGLEGGTSVLYGENLKAKCVRVTGNNWTLKIDSGFTNQQDWLNNVYWKTYPLYNPNKEMEAPTPNYFAISIDGIDHEFPISDWNQVLNITNSGVNNDKTLYVKFFKRMPTNDIQLTVSGLTMRESTSF